MDSKAHKKLIQYLRARSKEFLINIKANFYEKNKTYEIQE